MILKNATEQSKCMTQIKENVYKAMNKSILIDAYIAKCTNK